MEGALAELNKSWEDKVAESREQQEAARMRRSSVNGVAALKKNLQPMMVNLNEDGRVFGDFRPATLSNTDKDGCLVVHLVH
eukprot:g9690.t1